MWEYSTDLIKLEELKEKKERYDYEIIEHKNCLTKLEATFKQVSSILQKQNSGKLEDLRQSASAMLTQSQLRNQAEAGSP